MNILQVVKRDGTIQPFDRGRIVNAVAAAARAVEADLGHDWAEMISYSVVGLLNQRCETDHISIPSVEQIQDIVEEVLTKSNQYQIAKAYILYRQKRQESRTVANMVLDSEKLVEDYIKVMDWRVSENSNMNYSLQGLNFYLASTIAAKYWLNKIYPPEVREAHISASIHLHDLGAISVYCCGWDSVGPAGAGVRRRPRQN